MQHLGTQNFKQHNVMNRFHRIGLKHSRLGKKPKIYITIVDVKLEALVLEKDQVYVSVVKMSNVPF
jgi:hypothetical protein